MDKAVILVGTETGNAEDVAEDLAATLDELGVENEVVDMEDAAPDLLDGSRAVIVCTATHGDVSCRTTRWTSLEGSRKSSQTLAG